MSDHGIIDLMEALKASLARLDRNRDETKKEAPFDPSFNCPTHFVEGDPTCAACISKQPKEATP